MLFSIITAFVVGINLVLLLRLLYLVHHYLKPLMNPAELDEKTVEDIKQAAIRAEEVAAELNSNLEIQREEFRRVIALLDRLDTKLTLGVASVQRVEASGKRVDIDRAHIADDLADSKVVIEGVAADLAESKLVIAGVAYDLAESKVVIAGVAYDLAQSQILVKGVAVDLSSAHDRANEVRNEPPGAAADAAATPPEDELHGAAADAAAQLPPKRARKKKI